jgi:WD40 repeat protein
MSTAIAEPKTAASSSASAAAGIHAFYETAPSCRDAWQQIHLHRKPRIALLDAACVAHAASNRLLLLAVASNGSLYVWELPDKKDDASRRGDDDDDDDDHIMTSAEDDTPMMGRDDVFTSSAHTHTHNRRSTPWRICHIAKKALFSIRLASSTPNSRNEKQLLLIGGDDGLLLLDCDNLFKRLSEAPTTTCSLESLKLVNPIHFRPYPSPLTVNNTSSLASSEVNEALIQGDDIYAAVGDAFGLYKWNIETQQLIKTYKEASFLHSVQSLPAVNGSKNTNASTLLLTGGEDGVVQLWDSHHDALIETLPLLDLGLEHTHNKRNHVGKKGSAKVNTPWITSLAVMDTNWFSVVGGRFTGPGTGSAEQGFISTFDVPTRSIIAYTETRTKQHRATYLPNRSLATVANESVVSYYWYPTILDEPSQRSVCSSPSAHCLAIAPDGRIVVGGEGGVMDVFDPLGVQQLMQLSIELS